MSDPIELRVTFKGLCALAPKRDGSEARIFLVNESNADKDRLRPNLPPHFGAIRIPAEHLVSGGLKVPGSFPWFLRGSHIRFTNSAGYAGPDPGNLSIEGLDPSKQPSLVKAPKNNDRGIWWLAPIEKASRARGFAAGAGILDRSFLGREMDKEDAKLISARIELRDGSLGVENFLATKGNLIVWRFRESSGIAAAGDHFQILAGEILWKQKIESDYVVIEARDLVEPDDESKIRKLKIYPVMFNDKPRIDITILNEESEEFVLRRANVPLELRKVRDSDRLFESFYKLVSNPPPPDLRPLAVSDHIIETVVDDGGAQLAPPCSPSRLEAFD